MREPPIAGDPSGVVEWGCRAEHWLRLSTRITMAMIEVTGQLPDDIARRFGGAPGEIPRHVLEAVALEGFRSARLSREQVGELLHLDAGGTASFLAEHQIGGPTEHSAEPSDPDFEAFWNALPGLLKTDRGRFVAISGGQIVDRDDDEYALVKRVASRIPDARVRIQQVIEKRLQAIHIDTPEIEFINGAAD
jgi:hypothetical protein